MPMIDHRQLAVTGATAEAVDLYEAALAELRCYRGDPAATIDRALAAAPGFAMGHALKGHLGVLATERPGLDTARACASRVQVGADAITTPHDRRVES